MLTAKTGLALHVEPPEPTGAFEEVLTAHLDVLWRAALRLCRGHHANAEDLLQDTAMRAQAAYGGLRATGAARSWLLTIMTRHHLNRIRARKRRPEELVSDLSVQDFERALARADPLLGTERLFEQAALQDRL